MINVIIRIDTLSSVPVYAQIIDQIKRAIACGILAPGESLPSLRETAISLRVNPLTVSKAYKQLENEGLIETRHGLGSFVSANAPTTSGSYRREALAKMLDEVLSNAWQLGMSFEEVQQLLKERIQTAQSSTLNSDTTRSDTDE